MKPLLRVFLLTFVIINSFAAPRIAMAVLPGEMLDDPILEARARSISLGLRCLVCRNQSIDDSNASLARDLRILLRERISNGDSDEAAINYLVDRYGAYILLKPPVTSQTLLLWIGPLLLLLSAIIGFAVMFRKKSHDSVSKITALTREERKILNAVIKREDI